jgi:hypothetical protein
MDHHGRLATGLAVWSPGLSSPGVSLSSSSIGMIRTLGPSPDIDIPELYNAYLIPQCDSQATLWLKSGEPTYVVSGRLGRASKAFTPKQYAHVLPGQQREAVLRFAELINSDGSPSVRHQNHA